MFDNSGEKVKGLSHVLLLLGMIASLVCAIAFSLPMSRQEPFHLLRYFLILFGGGFGSYSLSLLLYAFGEAVNHLQTIAEGNGK